MKIYFAADENQVKENLIIEENNKYYIVNHLSVFCGIMSNSVGSVIDLVSNVFNNLKQDLPNNFDIITVDIDDKAVIDAVTASITGNSFSCKAKVIEITSFTKR